MRQDYAKGLEFGVFRGKPDERFNKVSAHKCLTRAVRVRLPLELADRYDTLTLEQRSALVVMALERGAQRARAEREALWPDYWMLTPELAREMGGRRDYFE